MASEPYRPPADLSNYAYCALRPTPVVAQPAGLSDARFEAIKVTEFVWANHEQLHYYFYDDAQHDGENVRMSDGTTQFINWVGDEAQRAIVRAAFASWKAIGTALDFIETTDRNEAQIRIGFMRGDGSWSYIGKQVLDYGPGERTMNFGWDLRTQPDTALHEIGHTLGMPHEHQNPFSGIVWNDEAVYAALAAPPNSWPRDKTFHNILRKLDPATVAGSTWDPNSIMHYPFAAGLIAAPPPYDKGLRPAGGLSPTDKSWIIKFYPPAEQSPYRPLTVATSAKLGLKSGEQADFLFTAPSTRKFTIQTTGICDTQLLLFEDVDGAWRFFDQDDDSGTDANARLRVRLRKGRRYAVRVRMRYNDTSTEPTVIVS